MGLVMSQNSTSAPNIDNKCILLCHKSFAILYVLTVLVTTYLQFTARHTSFLYSVVYKVFFKYLRMSRSKQCVTKIEKIYKYATN